MKTIFLKLVLILATAITIGCDKRTAEEKGADLANEKLDFAQGAADAVKQKGKDLGKSAGKGLGDLIKGIGSGVKDSMFQPVKIDPVTPLTGVGITIGKATEGKSLSDGRRTIDVHLVFSKAYNGRIELSAKDASKNELGRSMSDFISQANDSSASLSFAFDKTVRISEVDHFEPKIVAPIGLTIDADLATDGVKLERYKEQNDNVGVSAYLTFSKAYKSGIQLRAFSKDEKELARGETTVLDQAADSAKEFELSAPIENRNSVHHFILKKAPAPTKKSTKK